MKDLRPALRDFLLADPSINTAVGGSRIHPVILPQGVVAASIVYNRISGLGGHTMAGPMPITRPRYQLDAYASTPGEANTLADMIKQRLDGYSGFMGTGPQTIKVNGVFYDGEHDEYDPDAKMHRVRRDYFIWFEDR